MTELHGFVMLHRSIREWEWYTDMNTKAVFLELMLTANFKAKQYRGYDIPRGASVTSVASLANTLGLTTRNVRTALEHLKETGEVTISTTPKFSIIKLNNWDKYQAGDTQNGTQPTNDRQTTDNSSASDRQTTDNSSASNRQTTDNSSASDRQHLNNDNNDNNEYNYNNERFGSRAASAPTLSQIKDYFFERRYHSDPEMFYNYYSATDWKRKDTPITNWRPLADIWEKRGEQMPPYYDHSQSSYNSNSWNSNSSIHGDLSELEMFRD